MSENITPAKGGSQNSSDDRASWHTPLNLVDIFAPSQESTKVDLIGEIDRISVDNPTDIWSAGYIEVSGMRVVIPANLVIQMPVQRYTLQELFNNARPECLAKNQTGLARADDCFFERRGATATILANRTSKGVVVAGQVSIAKADEFLVGVVTYINHDMGYFYLNGIDRAETAGVMVRINDPQGRHSLQSGKGCDGGPNCSPDKRFPVDSDNYTAAFVTGYPLCIPSTKSTPLRTAQGAITLKFTSNALVGNDPNCPFAARTVKPFIIPVPDSRHFAPIKVGDSLEATGNFETIGGVRFLSSHTVRVHAAPTTSPGKPDYLTLNESVWDVAGFPGGRSRSKWIGFTTETTPRVDLYRLAIDPSDNSQHEVAMGSTVGNPGTVLIGVPIGNIFRMSFRDVFGVGASGKLSPCVHLANADIAGCDDLGTLDPIQNFKLMSPISREVILRSRNKRDHPDLVSFDLSGQKAPNGEYQAPVGVEHPDYLEINLNRIQTPHLFTGEPWNLDRRLGPQGCGGDRGSCSNSASLRPFPYDGGLDPGNQAIGVFPVPSAGSIISGYPYTENTVGPPLPWRDINVDTTGSVMPSTPVILECSP
ncbi:MAG: hypothetical protein NTY08_18840 [Proteobacteria bacterium]|nr:hypothetical protein [Pseudomonadota bacterium]